MHPKNKVYLKQEMLDVLSRMHEMKLVTPEQTSSELKAVGHTTTNDAVDAYNYTLNRFLYTGTPVEQTYTVSPSDDVYKRHILGTWTKTSLQIAAEKLDECFSMMLTLDTSDMDVFKKATKRTNIYIRVNKLITFIHDYNQYTLGSGDGSQTLQRILDSTEEALS